MSQPIPWRYIEISWENGEYTRINRRTVEMMNRAATTLDEIAAAVNLAKQLMAIRKEATQ